MAFQLEISCRVHVVADHRIAEYNAIKKGWDSQYVTSLDPFVIGSSHLYRIFSSWKLRLLQHIGILKPQK
jgi:hypothetical protein